jgi:hypothetical protein
MQHIHVKDSIPKDSMNHSPSWTALGQHLQHTPRLACRSVALLFLLACNTLSASSMVSPPTWTASTSNRTPGQQLTATWNEKAGAAGQQYTISSMHTSSRQGQHLNPLPRQLLQLLKGTAPAGQHATCSSSCAPERDSTCWTTLFHATCSSSKLLGQQSTSGQQAPRTAKQHGLHDFPQAGSKDKKKGESLLHKTPSGRKQKKEEKNTQKQCRLVRSFSF